MRIKEFENFPFFCFDPPAQIVFLPEEAAAELKERYLEYGSPSHLREVVVAVAETFFSLTPR